MKKQMFLATMIAALVWGMVGCSSGPVTTPAANNSASPSPNSAAADSKNTSPSPSNSNSNKDEKPKTASIEEEIDCASGAGGASNRVKFAPGKSSTTIKCSVIRGDRDTYLLGAKAGQTMTVRISALEKNAVFQIERPDGEYLDKAGEGDDQTKWTGKLPASGDYKIIVGGTRGNATYKISIAIK
jgi:hypothetical protein